MTDRAPPYPDGAGVVAAGGLASHRAVRQQPHRGRPWPSQVEAASDAWAKQGHNANVIIVGHAFIQNARRGHHELAVEEPVTRRVAIAFDELALMI